MKAPARLTRLTAIELNGDALPTEFRIFAAGENPSSKGATLFDADAAASVMAAYEAHGVDMILDLEHESLDEVAARADSRDARGHFRLELRNGELWAVGLRLTPDGETRLREKRQRYTSPAFLRDPKTNRVTELINVALVAMPATHNAAPLVAASAREDGRAALARCKAAGATLLARAKSRATAAIAKPAATRAQPIKGRK